MTVPNLPTDNLYKFLSLFGLVLIVVYIYLTFQNKIELSNQSDELVYKTELLNNKITQADRERLEMINKIDDLCQTKACGCSIAIKTKNSISLKFKGDCNDELITEQIEKYMSEIKINVDSLEIDLATLKAQNILLKSKTDLFQFLKIRLTILLFIGILLSILGFILWYLKVQKFQDKILKNDSTT